MTRESNPVAQMRDDVAEAGSQAVTRLRWAIGIDGAVSVAFAVAILVWPSLSLYALTILFGVYALLHGVAGLFGAAGMKAGRGWMVFSSLLGIVVGVAVLAWPDISALSLLYVIAAYAIAGGVVLLTGVLWLPLSGEDGVLLSLTGLVSVLFGIVMFAKPGAGALVLLALIAAFSLVIGLTQLVVAIGGRRIVQYEVAHLPKPAA
jgi:uncharacterized membrane protein HdeD (DUF308 family)